MKKINKTITAAILLAGISLQAQDIENPWAVTFGLNAVDTRGSAGNNLFDQFFKVDQNWNHSTSDFYVRADRAITNSLSLGMGGSVNRIERYVYEQPKGSGNFVTSNPGDLAFYSADVSLRLGLMKLLGSKWFDPYFNLGEGYTWFGPESYFVTKGGAGMTLWLTENMGLNLSTAYNYSFGDRDNPAGTAPNQPGYWQHFAGLSLKFGAKDTDKDGIYDKDDACPDAAGLIEFQGCPDTDGDGIIDINDKCPDVAGKPEFSGCPDADNDGLADTEDKCPNESGPKENEGCPWPDTDKDGILDKDDKCPDQPGPAANNGCPKIAQAEEKVLGEYTKTIWFRSGASTFDAATILVLDDVVGILKEYPSSKFSIEGHSDSSGSDELNLKLSQERATTVEKYLVEHSIDQSRLSSLGYGETRPIESNKTAKGRSHNRRVEIKLVK